MEEIWKDIKDYEGFYQVSNYGFIKSLKKEIIRKPHLTPKGYLRLQLQVKGSQKNFFVHRLVALTFLENPNNLPQINHIDGNKLNNKVDNLEWVDNSINQHHAYKIGLRKSRPKYKVICNELKIETLGFEKMVKELSSRGYDKVNSGCIYNCALGDINTHLGLSFSIELLDK